MLTPDLAGAHRGTQYQGLLGINGHFDQQLAEHSLSKSLCEHFLHHNYYYDRLSARNAYNRSSLKSCLTCLMFIWVTMLIEHSGWSIVQEALL